MSKRKFRSRRRWEDEYTKLWEDDFVDDEDALNDERGWGNEDHVPDLDDMEDHLVN